MLVEPLSVDPDDLVERERKKGGLFRIKEEVVWKRVLWWPYLDCVLNMEPYHPAKRITIVLAVDWASLKQDGKTDFDRIIKIFHVVKALFTRSPPEGALKEVPCLPETDIVVPPNVSLSPGDPMAPKYSEALCYCRDTLRLIRNGELPYGANYLRAMGDTREIIEGLMLPDGYEGEGQPEVAGIELNDPRTHGFMRDKGFWMVQVQRRFWVPYLVVYYAPTNAIAPYWRVVRFDREGRRLSEERGEGKVPLWLSQLMEHGALERTVEFLSSEFHRLDKERIDAKSRAEGEQAVEKAKPALEQLDRLLPSYKDLDRKLRFDLFCGAALFCHSIDGFARGVGYARQALELAPNDGRPHLCYAMNAVHFAETRADSVESALKAIQLPGFAEDTEIVSKALEVLKYCFEREGDAESLQKLIEGAGKLNPSVAEKPL